ncbi:MAG: glycosyltransferase [Thermoleophilia bacterium]|nr:glycosyltransferase [Thermoleophilia bacterium]
MRLLLVSLYWPPAGGAGVQRPLKLAGHLAALGHDVHVLAPDDPKWLHRDPSLATPPGVTVHRARNRGPRARRPAEELRSSRGARRLALRVGFALRGALAPDASVLWNATAAPAAIELARRLRVDVVLTTSPPGSVHLAGAAARRVAGVPWVADLRDSIAQHPHRRRDVRGERALARLVARRANAVVCASRAIADEMAALGVAGRLEVIGNGCDFEDFEGLEYRPGPRFRITHAGSFFGRRDPRPFLEALARTDGAVVARFVGDFRSGDREHAEQLGLGDRVELVPYLPRAEVLALQRDSEALLLLIPEAEGRGRGVLSGKVFEYLAAERPVLAAVPPDGEAAALIREVGAGVVVAPDDVGGLAAALAGLVGRWRAGALDGSPLRPEARARLSRRARAEELAAVLEGLR